MRPKQDALIFIAANPLQILMSISIIRQLGVARETTLVVHGGFVNAEHIAETFSPQKLDLDGLTVRHVESRKAAFLFVETMKPNEMFVDGDVGWKNFLILRSLGKKNPRLRINVFEEGVGTYRDDLHRGLKRMVFKFLGVGVNFGGSSRTSSVWVIEPKRYKAIFPRIGAAVRHIEDGPHATLDRHYKAWAEIFGFEGANDVRSTKCSLYLTDWIIRPEPIRRLLNEDGDRYIKIHPRCLEGASVPSIEVIGSGAPAELVITDLAQKYSSVQVFHHGSSTELYFSSHNVTFERL